MMTRIADRPRWFSVNLLLGAIVLASSASTSVAEAGYVLTLDSSSVRPSGNHYAIDVWLESNGEPEFDINGIVATVKSDRAGLVFLWVAQTANGIFGDDEYSPSAADQSPSSGNAEEAWTASVFLDSGTIRPSGSHPAFQLAFSAPEAGPYTIDFVHSGSPPSSGMTQFSYQGEENYEFGNFDQLTSASFIVSTPEPSSCLLLTTVMGGLGIWRWRRHSGQRPVDRLAESPHADQ